MCRNASSISRQHSLAADTNHSPNLMTLLKENKTLSLLAWDIFQTIKPHRRLVDLSMIHLKSDQWRRAIELLSHVDPSGLLQFGLLL